jgi:hypothetical protein
MIKYIVAGSRSYKHTSKSFERLSECILKSRVYFEDEFSDSKDITIISGDCHGPDRMGAKWARENDIEVEVYPADWDRHGKAAGMIRNAEMADAGDVLICFWDGESRGTKNMIQEMAKINKGVICYIFDENCLITKHIRLLDNELIDINTGEIIQLDKLGS